VIVSLLEFMRWDMRWDLVWITLTVFSGVRVGMGFDERMNAFVYESLGVRRCSNRMGIILLSFWV
jgi:hypothetical protein